MRFKPYLLLTTVLTFALTIVVVLTLASADEFKCDGPPAFTVTYPKGSKTEENLSKENVWSIKTPKGVIVRARVEPIPEGMEVKDVAEKHYMPLLIKATKTSVQLLENKEMTLSDGTKAYYSEMKWKYRGGRTGGFDYVDLVTMLVSVYKDGKLIILNASPWENFDENMEIVKSLRFQ